MTLFEKIMSHKIRFIKNCMFLVILHSAYNLLKQESYLAISKRKATFLLNKISPYSGKNITKHRVNFLGKNFCRDAAKNFSGQGRFLEIKTLTMHERKVPEEKISEFSAKGTLIFKKGQGIPPLPLVAPLF